MKKKKEVTKTNNCAIKKSAKKPGNDLCTTEALEAKRKRARIRIES